MNLQRLLGTFVIIIAVWFALLGDLAPVNLTLGFVLAVLVNAFFQRTLGRYISTNILRQLLVGFAYLPLFLLEIFQASLRLTVYTLSPRPALKPAIVQLPIQLESPMAMTMLGIMITLTPGTLTLDLDPDKKLMWIHWYNMTTTNESRIKEKAFANMEQWAERIFQR
jgi:multicomponent Na+:H+ antiporter subunit E